MFRATAWIKRRLPGGSPVAKAAWGLAVVIGLTAPARADFIHRYSFNNGTANDSVGTADGTLSGGATISNGQLVTTGPHGQGAALPAAATSGVTGDFAIEQWFTRADTNANYSQLFSFATDTGHFLLVNPERPGNGVPGNDLAVDFNSGSGEVHLYTNGAPGAGTQHMIAITYSAGTQTASLYYDGALVPDVAGSSQGTLNIGAFNLQDISGTTDPNPNRGINDFSPFTDPSFNGSTNEFRLFNNAQTTSQVAADFLAGPDALPSASPEPGSLTLAGVVGLGAAGYGWLRRRRVRSFRPRLELLEDRTCLSTVVNFDAINALPFPGGVGGTALANYLAGYGMSISKVTPGTFVVVMDYRNEYGGQATIPPSLPNLLTQVGSNDPVSFEVDFAVPQDSFGFTRPALIAGPSGITHPQWDAFAFDATGHELDHVGEGLIASFSNVPAATYTLHGPGITAVEFASNNFHFAAFSAVLLDDFVLSNSVNNPLPTTTSLAPNTVPEGTASFGLTVDGNNFIPNSVVRWNGTALTTTFVGSTQLTATIPAADVAEEGAFPVTVFSPGPGGGTSNAQTFTVTDAPLTPLRIPVRVIAGAPFSGAVASFTDANPSGVIGDFSAKINWGDGAVSSGTISTAAAAGFTVNAFNVTGSHTYAAPGSYTVRVQIVDDGGSKTTAVSTATVASLGLPVQKGLTAETGFWAGKKGQALIDEFNGGPNATVLARWLATTFPNLYGANAGAHNLLNFNNTGGVITAATNAQVAAFYLSLLHEKGPKLDAAVLDTALDVYATTLSLGGTVARQFGFTVNAYGLGAYSFNVGHNGAAFGVPNDTTLDVYQILKAADKQAKKGVLYNGNKILQGKAERVFAGIDHAGHIT
jgi:hypothetical protein